MDVDDSDTTACGSGTYVDVASPGTSHTCACTDGFEEVAGVCVEIDGCQGVNCGVGNSCEDILAFGS